MGRYDKIRVYDGSEWKQPTQILVYNGTGWLSLGENDSNETKSLNVRKNNDFVRATLNKTNNIVYGDTYTYGDGFVLTGVGSNGQLLRYCHEKTYGDWVFRATIKKTDNSAKRVFFLGNASNYIYITWNENGTITVTNRSQYQGSEYSVTTTNAVYAGSWVYLDIVAPKGGSNVIVNFNGVRTSGKFYGTWYNRSASYDIGDPGLLFKDNMTIQGRDYDQGHISITINMSSGTDVANKCRGAYTTTDTSSYITWT